MRSNATCDGAANICTRVSGTFELAFSFKKGLTHAQRLHLCPKRITESMDSRLARGVYPAQWEPFPQGKGHVQLRFRSESRSLCKRLTSHTNQRPGVENGCSRISASRIRRTRQHGTKSLAASDQTDEVDFKQLPRCVQVCIHHRNMPASLACLDPLWYQPGSRVTKERFELAHC